MEEVSALFSELCPRPEPEPRPSFRGLEAPSPATCDGVVACAKKILSENNLASLCEALEAKAEPADAAAARPTPSATLEHSPPPPSPRPRRSILDSDASLPNHPAARMGETMCCPVPPALQLVAILDCVSSKATLRKHFSEVLLQNVAPKMLASLENYTSVPMLTARAPPSISLIPDDGSVGAAPLC